ncbi:MAG TPA: phosphoribosylformylglycinamidine cyclo-ligase, partial [Chromatiales bacterium]|nr:phosphoribosylformylglycinamidine cyclo-ligase [Chromatiales bacterium]
MDYRSAGVDIEAGSRLVERIRPAVERTRRPEVLGSVGGFGGLFQLPLERYRHPVLVSGTDGVGTKLLLARRFGEHAGIGIDLVAMCANDVLVTGAEPLFFLDYFATGRLEVEQAARVVEGIAAGCREAGCALIGGETAEMPGLYAPGDYDLAGFCVGVVERDALLDGSAVRIGDRLLGLASTGPHANGYSLIRRILDTSGADPDEPLDGTTLGEALLTPTRIYVRALLPMVAAGRIHAMAHITGGGLTDNLPRVLPRDSRARVQREAWRWPAVFRWIQRVGGVEEAEMLRTFNCGIGMVLILDPGQVGPVRAHC